MNRDLTDTKASAILAALTDARHNSGVAALGMVLTLVIDVDEGQHYDAMHAATAAAREHPCRIVTLIRRPGTSSVPRLDAEIRVGDDSSLGEVIVLRLYGPLRKHADSVVLPLLLPDAPVLVWWPGVGPTVPSEDPLGMLAQRRVTDAAAIGRPLQALKARCDHHSPGDTDFAWTRLTPWRTLLASSLDRPFDEVVGAEVGAARSNPSAELLATWLEWRLGVPVIRTATRGPGITDVRLLTKRGEIAITRPDGRLATLVRSGEPDRTVALPRRSTEELLAEELRRLDPDDIYNEVICRTFGTVPVDEAAAAEATARAQEPSAARKSASARAKKVGDAENAARITAAADTIPTRPAPAAVDAGTSRASTRARKLAAQGPEKKVPTKKAPTKKAPTKKAQASTTARKAAGPAKKSAGPAEKSAGRADRGSR